MTTPFVEEYLQALMKLSSITGNDNVSPLPCSSAVFPGYQADGMDLSARGADTFILTYASTQGESSEDIQAYLCGLDGPNVLEKHIKDVSRLFNENFCMNQLEPSESSPQTTLPCLLIPLLNPSVRILADTMQISSSREKNVVTLLSSPYAAALNLGPEMRSLNRALLFQNMVFEEDASLDELLEVLVEERRSLIGVSRSGRLIEIHPENQEKGYGYFELEEYLESCPSIWDWATQREKMWWEVVKVHTEKDVPVVTLD